MSTTLPIKNRNKVKRLLAYLRGRSPRDALLFQTGINTSLRIGDLLRLQVHHVMKNDKIRKYIDIKEQKTGKHNRIAISTKVTKENTAPLSVVLKSYIERYSLTENDYIFFKVKHHHNKNEPINRDWASKVLVAAAQACDITHFNTQSMRKTHAYHVYMATEKNIVLVQTMLNHSSPTVTLRYIGITQSEIDNAKEIVSF